MIRKLNRSEANKKTSVTKINNIINALKRKYFRIRRFFSQAKKEKAIIYLKKISTYFNAKRLAHFVWREGKIIPHSHVGLLMIRRWCFNFFPNGSIITLRKAY